MRSRGCTRLEVVLDGDESADALVTLGFAHEGTLRGYVDDSLRRCDVELWALTAPLGGD